MAKPHGQRGDQSGGPAPPRGGFRGAGISAVVVNHDAGDRLLSCVASLRRAGVADVVVVDNASADGSLDALAAADLTVTLLPTGANLGYGRAVNRGMAAAGAELVLVCNPDLVVDVDAPRLLAEALVADEALAVAGPLVLEEDGSVYPSARAFPAPVVAALHTLVGPLWPGNPWSRRYRMEDEGVAERDADWVSGACLLVRRIAFASVGGFDEGYFMYVEDLDLCWRLRRAGWGVRYVPAARVVHAQGVSAGRHPLRMAVAHHRSAWRFARRSTEGPARLLLPLVAAALAARLALVVGRLLAEGVGHRDARRGLPGAAPLRLRRPRLE